jgi:RNA polymerase sigma-70 factor (ECF subfamily)
METDRLVGMVRQGDTEAFGKLVEKYWQYIVGLAFGYVGNIGDAEDVAQDAFITAYLKLDRLKDDHTSS